MPIDISFTDSFNSSSAAKVADFLRQPRLYIDTQADYGSAHQDWVERTEHDLVMGRKFGIAAIEAGQVVGSVIAKIESPETVGIRNISMSPEVRRRDFGRFSTAQLLYIVQQELPDVSRVVVDTKPENRAMVEFLKKLKFREVGLEDLYSSGQPDLVLERTVSQSKAD